MSALISSNFTGDSLWAELGGQFEQRSFDRRVLALSNPDVYAAERTAELAKIKKASERAFKTSYEGFIQAGLSPDASKAAALQSAQSEYANQMRVFSLMYGQGTDQLYETRKGHPTFRSMLGGGTASRRAAPRRRRRKKNSK